MSKISTDYTPNIVSQFRVTIKSTFNEIFAELSSLKYLNMLRHSTDLALTSFFAETGHQNKTNTLGNIALPLFAWVARIKAEAFLEGGLKVTKELDNDHHTL